MCVIVWLAICERLQLSDLLYAKRWKRLGAGALGITRVLDAINVILRLFSFLGFSDSFCTTFGHHFCGDYGLKVRFLRNRVLKYLCDVRSIKQYSKGRERTDWV